MKKNKFTLLELLIVIAVIALLVTILLPSLQNARRGAYTAVCASNLSQLGKALSVYVVENNNFYPYTRKKGTNADIISWDELISGYDGRERMTISEMKVGTTPQENPLYKCPEDTIPGIWGQPKRSYGITRLIDSNNLAVGISGSIVAAADDPAELSDISRQLTKINYSSETILLSENFNGKNRMGVHWGSIDARTHLTQWTANDPARPVAHINKANYLFTDGHVEVMNYYETLLGRPPSDSDARETMWDAGR